MLICEDREHTCFSGAAARNVDRANMMRCVGWKTKVSVLREVQIVSVVIVMRVAPRI